MKTLTSKEQFLVDSIFKHNLISTVPILFEGRCQHCGMETVQHKDLDKTYSICLSPLGIKTLKGMLYEQEKKEYQQEHPKV